MLNGASFFGRWVVGAATVPLGLCNALVFCCFASSILLFCWPSTTSNAQVIVFASLYGFCSGGALTCLPPVVLNLCPKPAYGGLYVGLASAIMSFGALGSSPIGGKVSLTLGARRIADWVLPADH